MLVQLNLDTTIFDIIFLGLSISWYTHFMFFFKCLQVKSILGLINFSLVALSPIRFNVNKFSICYARKDLINLTLFALGLITSSSYYFLNSS